MKIKFQSLSWWNENLKDVGKESFYAPFLFQSLSWWNENLKSIKPKHVAAIHFKFQSLSWWNENLKDIITALEQEKALFQSLSWWNENLKPEAAPPPITIVLCFNPCLGGMRI